MERIALAWIYLLIASAFEAGWAIGLKQSHGFSRLWPSVWTVFAMVLSVLFLALAVKHLPVGTAYAVWTGIGAATVGVIGILFLGEPANPMRLVSLALIVTGVVGLRFLTPPS